jgi:hypothetical protein
MIGAATPAATTAQAVALRAVLLKLDRRTGQEYR